MRVNPRLLTRLSAPEMRSPQKEGWRPIMGLHRLHRIGLHEVFMAKVSRRVDGARSINSTHIEYEKKLAY